MATSDDTTTSERTARWERSDKIQALGAVLSFLALAVAIVALVSANSAGSKANQLAAIANRANLTLASLPSSRGHGTSEYQVGISLINQGGGTAQDIKAYIGTLVNIHERFGRSCPHAVRTFVFVFPGTALGAGQALNGTASVPAADVPRGGTPANSMAVYVSWHNNDGTKRVSCLNLSNGSRLGNLIMFPL